MPTLFTKIIDGEIPAQFVWEDETAVAFLSIDPMGPGHTLIVPRAEVDSWVEAPESLLAHLHAVGHRVARAIQAEWKPPRVALVIAGFEVPHLHLHVYPAWSMEDFNFEHAKAGTDSSELDGNAEALRRALRRAGHSAHVPGLES